MPGLMTASAWLHATARLGPSGLQMPAAIVSGVLTATRTNGIMWVLPFVTNVRIPVLLRVAGLSPSISLEVRML